MKKTVLVRVCELALCLMMVMLVNSIFPHLLAHGDVAKNQMFQRWAGVLYRWLVAAKQDLKSVIHVLELLPFVFFFSSYRDKQRRLESVK